MINRLKIIGQILQDYGLKTRHLVVILLLFLAMSVIGFFLPQKIHEIYDDTQKASFFLQSIIILTVIFILQYFVRVIYQYYTTKLCQQILQNMRTDLFRKWMLDRSSWAAHGQADRFPLGEILSRMLKDSDAIKEIIDNGSLTIFIDLIFVAATLISLMQIDLFLGAIFSFFQLLIIFLLFKGSWSMSFIFHQVRKSYGQVTQAVTDLIKGIPQIFDAWQDRYAIKRITPIQNEYLLHQLKSNLYDASYYSFAESLFPIFTALLVVLTLITHQQDLALIAVLIDVLQRSINPIKEVASKMSVIQRAYTGIQRVQEFRRHLHPVAFLNHDVSREYFMAHVQQMTISWPEYSYAANESRQKFVLQPLEIILKRGESLGIVGQSGSGKTTMLRMLALQVHASGLRVTVNGNETTHFLLDQMEDQKKWSSCLSIISQDAHLFGHHLLYNLTFELELSPFRNEQWEILCQKIPYLKKWGIQLMDKLPVATLSFGQRQLIAALRSYFLPRPIILLDEVSAGMDSVLEDSFYQVMQLSQQQIFTIIVAHRLETITRCQQILLIDQGRKTAMGTHEYLQRHSPEYQRFLSALT